MKSNTCSVIFLFAITASLLKSAEMVIIGKNFRLYRKYGGEKQALKDFLKLKPKLVDKDPVSGTVFV